VGLRGGQVSAGVQAPLDGRAFPCLGLLGGRELGTTVLLSEGYIVLVAGRFRNASTHRGPW
jgi:hypothetical protein